MNTEKGPQFNNNTNEQEQTNTQILEQKIKELEIEKQILKEEIQKIIKEANSREQELKIEIEKLKTDLIHDRLTGLKSRKYFEEKARDDISTVSAPEIEKRKEGFKNVSFLFCDIDYFKKINDTYGHSFGDEILKEVARLLEANLRDNDTVCRWAGDEIAISLLGDDENQAADKAEELRKIVEEEIIKKYSNNPKYTNLKVSMSVGVSSFEDGLDFDELINRGDLAMYLVKKEGRNCVKTYSQFLEEKEKTDSSE